MRICYRQVGLLDNSNSNHPGTIHSSRLVQCVTRGLDSGHIQGGRCSFVRTRVTPPWECCYRILADIIEISCFAFGVIHELVLIIASRNVDAAVVHQEKRAVSEWKLHG